MFDGAWVRIYENLYGRDIRETKERAAECRQYRANIERTSSEHRADSAASHIREFGALLLTTSAAMIWAPHKASAARPSRKMLSPIWLMDMSTAARWNFGRDEMLLNVYTDHLFESCLDHHGRICFVKYLNLTGACSAPISALLFCH
jgi:hypothetical protein